MSFLLNIDTATSYASVCISQDGEVMSLEANSQQKEHAGFLHGAINNGLKKAGIGIKRIDAVAVTSGPGSYTGLRVGMSAAKGFCFALGKPMICVNTLEVMAMAAIKSTANDNHSYNLLYCPMIDARRLEVFTAIYDKNLRTVLQPCAMILNPLSINVISPEQVLCTGDGAGKFKNLNPGEKYLFKEVQHSAADLALLAHGLFKNRQFSDPVYTAPEYYKEFFTTANARVEK